MRTRAIADRSITALGFGGASLGNLGRETTAREAQGAVNTAWEMGVRYFDTAPHYGLGLSEQRLGAALATRPRGAYVLSTKVGRILEPNPHPSGSDLIGDGFAVSDTLRRRFDFSADGVQRSLEASLTRLGTDRVDIVYVHDPDDHVDAAINGAIPALIALRDEGVIDAVGVGMNQWQAPLRMVRETDLDAVMLAGRWTLLDRSGEPLLAACAERGVAVIAAAPYNSGLLAGDRPRPGATFDYQPASEQMLARARELANRCESVGVPLPAAALQFPLRDDVVASVVCGLRTSAQVRDAIARLDHPIPPTLWAALDADRTAQPTKRRSERWPP